MVKKIFFLLIINIVIIGCASQNHTKTETKILDFESAGNPISALSVGSPSAAALFLMVDIANAIKFNLNQKEIDLHTNAIHVALNNTRNGEIVSWHNGERLSSGDVRVVSTYYKKTGYCRIFQSYIKLNGAEKHTTKNVCKVNNVWQF